MITPILPTTISPLTLAILLLPFLSFVLNGFWLGRKNAQASAVTSTLLLGITSLAATILLWEYYHEIFLRPEIFPSHTAIAWEWLWMKFDLGSGLSPSIKMGFLLDPISMMMVWVISFISFLVHFYSIGYMHDDKGAGRFFPLLSFFTFAMLGLVVATNLAQTFFFWELVGTASYLLIGFWYVKPAAVAASKKAFILTRFTDAFFLIGLLFVGAKVGSFDFSVLNSPFAVSVLNHPFLLGNVHVTSLNVLTLVTLLIYMGAWGKSALFPFHVWLPDAMEGPTPVSSLIHSATMVVAGIYLTARLFPLFAAAEYTLRVVEMTGIFTALFAAIIACTQTDLKRILAFSTLSQLGLMMFALGTGNTILSSGFSASMFHVFTHAFFKCLLFLSAGIIIHAIHSNDIRDAGNLRTTLPRTYWTTLIACLAIAGVFPFAGFFSKEEILHAAWSSNHHLGFFVVLCISGLTAFYMSRYFLLVFHGRVHSPSSSNSAASPHASTHSSENPNRPFREGSIMTLPIIILAIPSVLAGWLTQQFFHSETEPSFPWLSVLASGIVLASIGLSWYLYGLKKISAGYSKNSNAKFPALYRIVYHKFYIDEIYFFIIKKILAKWVASPINWFEKTVINGIFDWVTYGIRRFSSLQSLVQGGQVQFYLATSILGLLTLIWFSRIHF